MCSQTSGSAPATLTVMTLFDAVDVTPPGPCSRCHAQVPATSLFCPNCGQSMVRPKPQEVAETPVVAEAPNAKEPAPETPEKTTGWLRRSLNLGKKPDQTPPTSSSVTEDLQTTQKMSLFDIEEAEAVAEKKPVRRPAQQARFVLHFASGASVTVGETSGVMGVKPVSEGESVFRIFVDDPTDTVAPEHLEFGVEKGVFWVQDLKTVNGTVVEEPGSAAIQCIPYEKYFVVRGSTVSIGQLSFTLS